jgi:hypothetical protein
MWCGNVFTDPLASNGYTCHNIKFRNIILLITSFLNLPVTNTTDLSIFLPLSISGRCLMYKISFWNWMAPLQPLGRYYCSPPLFQFCPFLNQYIATCISEQRRGSDWWLVYYQLTVCNYNWWWRTMITHESLKLLNCHELRLPDENPV